jgi:hypothetical protein
MALAACLAVIATLDGTGDHDAWLPGPGLTVDEPFNVQQGVLLADRLLEGDLAGFARVDAQFPDHPLLGRLWIGLCHELALLLWPSKIELPYSVTCARTASALSFAATVLLVGWFTSRLSGRVAGGGAALALVLMPRLFGHAHLASLETHVNLAYAAVLFYLADRARDKPVEEVGPPSRSRPVEKAATLATAAWAGVLLGLALLTKIQAMFLPISVLAWVTARIVRLHSRAAWLRWLMWLAVFGAATAAVFVGCWPWVWSDPLLRIGQYLGRATDRAAIHVWYFGVNYADRDVPWHYPWVLFATTVPVGLHFLGVLGLLKSELGRRWAASEQLLLAGVLLPLVVFSVPGVPVYDGERLFSVVFPVWCPFIGQGASCCVSWLGARARRPVAAVVAALFLMGQAWGLVAAAPCWLGYYNALVGGPRGAAALGLQTTYWAEGLSRGLLAKAAVTAGPNATLALAPTLHDLHAVELARQSAALRSAKIKLVPLVGPEAGEARYALIFTRREYLPPALADPSAWRIVAAVERQGVVLAALVELAPSTKE